MDIKPLLATVLFALIAAPSPWVNADGSTISGILNSTGLPLTLPADYVASRGFVDLGKDEAEGPDVHAPIASQLSFDGTPIAASDPVQLGAVFTENFLASLPQGTSIEVSLDSRGKESWAYPLGTEVVHLATYRDALTKMLSIQELRLERKVAQDRWALGIYTPENGNETLRLNVDGDGITPVKREFTALNQLDQVVHVRMERMPTESCRGCHGALSVMRDSIDYHLIDSVGPCGFVPENRELRTSWAAKYEQVRGESPFSPSWPKR